MSSDAESDARRGEGGPSAAGDDREPILLGVMAGPWRPAFDNWVEMAERYGHRYRIIGREIGEYVPHLTKWRCLLDCLRSLPRGQLVFHLDAADAFVCSDPRSVLQRYRFYGKPVLLGAERLPHPTHAFDVPDPAWRWANSGAFVAEAGVMADALQGGYELQDWERFGRVCDQHALILYFHRPEHRHLATIDFRRMLVANVDAMREPRDWLSRVLFRLPAGEQRRLVSSLHFLGGNRAGYNVFAGQFGLRAV